MKKILTISLLLLISLSGFSQKYYELEEMFLDADSWFFYEDYREALPLFQRVLAADSLNYNVMYKIGFCYLHIPGQKTKSIPYFEKAAENYTLNYRNNTFAETKAPLDALFYLGNAYLINNQIDEAIDAYTAFQNKISQNKKFANKDIYDEEYLQKQFDACRNALKFQDNPINFIASNIGSPINTRFSEYNPVVSGDGSTLVFTASLQFYDAIFFSKKKDGEWSYPVNLMSQLGVDGNTSTVALSYDGTELYLYRDDDFIGNIYVSFYRNGSWTKIKKLNENINTKYWEAHASLSPDGNELYFVSNREGGYGDLDIYVSERLTDTTWSQPKNLGKEINTQWNENTPFLTADGSKLFFSSEGHENMGGYDIFYSEKINGQWSTPKNIGYPINTTDDDLFFVPYENGKFAYSSEYSDYGYGGSDIYLYQLFHIPESSNVKIEGVLTMDNSHDRNREDFEIFITDSVSKDTIAVLNPDKDAPGYEYRTPRGKDHLVWEGKSDQGNQYFISKDYKIKEVFLEPIELKEPKKLALEDSVPEIRLEKDNYTVISDQESVQIK
ncbi:MAG: tetratricopeptide repeat protein, partial [Bacteroidales bacterium]